MRGRRAPAPLAVERRAREISVRIDFYGAAGLGGALCGTMKPPDVLTPGGFFIYLGGMQ